MMSYTDSLELEHFGVKGMKWGVRRYQNADGTLTAAGKEKLKNYKFEESNKVRKRYTRTKNAEERYQTRKKKQGVLVSEKHNTAVKNQLDRYQKELQAISKMKYKDMQKEKVEVGKAWVKDLGVSFASVTAASAVGIPFAPIFYPNVANIKQNSRIGSSKKKKGQSGASLV